MILRSHIYLVSILILVGSCKGPYIPLPPSYDSECRPTDKFYLDLAQETRDLAKDGEIPSNPKEAVSKALLILSSMGVGTVEKKVIGMHQFDDFTSALPKHVYVKPGFWETSIQSQASVLWHEIVHIRQWKRLGPEKMATLWLVYPEGRWAIETPAFRESFRVMRAFGINEKPLHDAIDAKIDSFYGNYALAPMPKQCMAALTTAIWFQDGTGE